MKIYLAVKFERDQYGSVICENIRSILSENGKFAAKKIKNKKNRFDFDGNEKKNADKLLFGLNLQTSILKVVNH